MAVLIPLAGFAPGNGVRSAYSVLAQVLMLLSVRGHLVAATGHYKMPMSTYRLPAAELTTISAMQ